MKDLTIIYYTSNQISDHFMANTQRQLLKAVGDTQIISVSFKPTVVGPYCTNYCIGEQKRSGYTLYKQVLYGAKLAKTKYVATAEDDMLYCPEHFTHRPPDDETLSYDVNKWSIFTWVKPPIFSFRIRKSMSSLVTTKAALVKTLGERYTKYPTLESIPRRVFKYYWGEPGRFERHLGISPMKMEEYNSPVPNIIFSTSEALGFLDLGIRKAHTQVRATEIKPWGTAEEILKLYG